jgi:hypothetical protein
MGAITLVTRAFSGLFPVRRDFGMDIAHKMAVNEIIMPADWARKFKKLLTRDSW